MFARYEVWLLDVNIINSEMVQANRYDSIERAIMFFDMMTTDLNLCADQFGYAALLTVADRPAMIHIGNADLFNCIKLYKITGPVHDAQYEELDSYRALR